MERYSLADRVKCSLRSILAKICEAWKSRTYRKRFTGKNRKGRCLVMGDGAGTSKSFCILPWIHLEIVPYGIIKICCVANELIMLGETFAAAGRDSISDIWNSQYLQEVRREMLADESLSACQYCNNQAERAVTTLRDLQNREWSASRHCSVEELEAYARDKGVTVDTPPSYLQLSLGNECNLKCRMCNGGYSSKVAQDEVHLAWIDPPSSLSLKLQNHANLRLVPGEVPHVEKYGITEKRLDDGSLVAELVSNAVMAFPLPAGTSIGSIEITLHKSMPSGIAVRLSVNEIIVFDDIMPVSQKLKVQHEWRPREKGNICLRLASSLGNTKPLLVTDISIFTMPETAQRGGAEGGVSVSTVERPWFKSDELFADQLFAAPEKIEKLYFTGGEPMLSSRLQAILDRLLQFGIPEKVCLIFNTNGTVANWKTLERLKQFACVYLGCSIDGYGQYNEYIRFPAKWSSVLETLSAFRSIKHFTVATNPTVQAYNVLNLDELYKFCDEQDLFCCPQIMFGPHFLTVQALPELVRETAAQRLESFARTEAKNEILRRNRELLGPIIQYLRQYAVTDVSSKLLRDFMLFTNDLDKSRGQDFKTTHWEMVDLLSKSGICWSEDLRFAGSSTR